VIGQVDEIDATKELLNSKGKILVYHSDKDEVILQLRNRRYFRRTN